MKVHNNQFLKSKCLIITPNGSFKKGTVFVYKKWKQLMEYPIGSDLNSMFDKVKLNKKTHKQNLII